MRTCHTTPATCPPAGGLTDKWAERRDLLESLRAHRSLLRSTAHRSTVSELTIGEIIKHVAAVESAWADFIVHGPRPSGPMAERVKALLTVARGSARTLQGAQSDRRCRGVESGQRPRVAV